MKTNKPDAVVIDFNKRQVIVPKESKLDLFAQMIPYKLDNDPYDFIRTVSGPVVHALFVDGELYSKGFNIELMLVDLKIGEEVFSDVIAYLIGDCDDHAFPSPIVPSKFFEEYES